MKGIQFVFNRKHFYPEKSLFWIEKQYRTSPQDYQVVSVYYVLNFAIFQAPTLSHIVDTRINNSIFFQKKAFEIIQSASDILYTRPTTWQEEDQKTNALEQAQNTARQSQLKQLRGSQTSEPTAEYITSQTNELDFIFELAEAPMNTPSAVLAEKENEALAEMNDDLAPHLSERDIQSIWHAASKLHQED